MRPIIIGRGATIAVLCASQPLCAAATNQRLNPVLETKSRGQFTRIVAGITDDEILSLADRRALQNARTRRYVSAVDGFDLKLSLSRFRGGRADAAGVNPASDRYAGQAARVELGLPLAGGFSLQPSASLERVKRHLTIIGDIFRPRTTIIENAGVGLSTAIGVDARFDWMRSAPQGHRSPLERMAELAGGATPASSGFRFALYSPASEAVLAPVGWNLTFASMHRLRSDSAFETRGGSLPDMRAEIGLTVAF